MTAVLSALLPLFVLIALGYGARWIGWPGPKSWRVVEQLTYYILFPALLFSSLAGTSLAGGSVVALALALTTVATTALALLAQGPLLLSGPTFSSVIQGAIRPNTYVGVGAALAVWGDQGVALAAVGLATVIPIVNVIAVVGLLRYAPSEGSETRRSLILSLIRNPLIGACLAGLTVNAVGFELPDWLMGSMKMLGQASLPLGLLAVGGCVATRRNPQPLGSGRCVVRPETDRLADHRRSAARPVRRPRHGIRGSGRLHGGANLGLGLHPGGRDGW